MAKFHVLSRGTTPPATGKNSFYLRVDLWNDYSYVTMFDVFIFDEKGVRYDLNNVKIGFVGQTADVFTYNKLEPSFTKLSDQFFSVGTDVLYYKTLYDALSDDLRAEFLAGIRDVASDSTTLEVAKAEHVFSVSHLRSLSLSTIENQFRRVLTGGALLTNYDFRFTLDKSLQDTPKRAGFQLEFKVDADSKPSTNIHALIGRNGVGKTTLLNSMIEAAINPSFIGARFEDADTWSDYCPMDSDYFSGVISISFSAFDPFNPPAEQSDPATGTRYSYVGLKDREDEDGVSLRPLSDLYEDFLKSLKLCLSEVGRRKRWLSAIKALESDENFAAMQLGKLADPNDPDIMEKGRSLRKRMSSGHAIVLLTITKLVASLEEKTLVLFDEPESHLHPPLLSALVRSLSELLHDRNGVAIMATHSPVVLQEIPKSCVWKITRSGLSSSWTRPETETFGENVGVLTREVFGLEVSKSGFNALLTDEAKAAATYEEALSTFGNQVGLEGRAILRSLMHTQGKR